MDHNQRWERFIDSHSQKQIERLSENQHFAIFRYLWGKPDITVDEHTAAVVNWQRQVMEHRRRQLAEVRQRRGNGKLA